MPLTPQELRQRLAKAVPPAPESPPTLDTKALLEAANSASQQVAVLHIAFMAVCAYVLVIVFGTTDMDLMMGGNNVKLPVIDVMVPITGFYAAVPYLVVLMHLNLLLQLQLLSRKLFAFDAAVPAEEGVKGLRDQLHIFPYTYYLVGRPSRVVGGLLGLVVSVTLVMLPLATLLSLQLKFLAYQAAGITWAQRFAVFLDVGLLGALWPVILHPRDDWQAWWRETLTAHLRRKWAWLAVIILIASLSLILFAATPDLFTVGLTLGAAAPLLLIGLNGRYPRGGLLRALLSLTVLWALSTVLGVLMWGSANALSSLPLEIPVLLFLGALPLAFFWHPTVPRGSLALLSALVLGSLLTLGLMVDGESWESAVVALQKPLLSWQLPTQWAVSTDENDEEQPQSLVQQFGRDDCLSIGHTMLSCVILAEQRRLDLEEQALFAKPPTPELLAALRAGKGLENQDKLERISLVDRSLRRAHMKSALLVGADLRDADLQSADLRDAQLQGATLNRAELQGADLFGANLQGATLNRAELQGAALFRANLQGATLNKVELQGAALGVAQLQGADLRDAQLQGAALFRANLQGTTLERAELQGAALFRANLQGADLRGATLYRNDNPAQSALLDIRGTTVEPLPSEEASEIQAMLKSISSADQEQSLQRLKSAAEPGAVAPTFDSCLTDGENQPKCQQTYDETQQRDEFVKHLHEVLATLSCEDTDIAHGILRQIPSSDFDQDSTRAGLATVLRERMNANDPCPGLANLPTDDKTTLKELAKEEAERQPAAKAARAGQR